MKVLIFKGTFIFQMWIVLGIGPVLIKSTQIDLTENMPEAERAHLAMLYFAFFSPHFQKKHDL